MSETRKWTGRLAALAAIASIGIVSDAAGAQLHVPRDFATIQAGVDAAAEGDEVVVAAGTYSEAVDLRGKKITLRSAAGAAATILDGAIVQASIITAVSGESLETRLEGFTFRNGIGRFTQACNLGGFLGGAIYVEDGGISVIDSIFENNGTYDEETGTRSINGGGAIFACDADLSVSGSSFESNAANFGGAIRFHSSAHHATIANGRFIRNRAAHGGGIEARLFLESSLIVTGSGFEGNESSHGGGLRLDAYDRATARISTSTFRGGVASFGGGANVTAEERVRIELHDVDFIANEAGFGGGLFTIARGRLPAVQGARISVTDGRFFGNVAHRCCNTGQYADGCFADGLEASELFYGGGADARTINGGFVTFTNSLFARNSGMRAGGAHASSCDGGIITFANSTIADNEGSGLHLRLALYIPSISTGIGEIHVVNSIVRDNSEEVQIPVETLATGPTSTVTFSNVEGGFAGLGNIDADSTFVDAIRCDYRLAAGAGEIDAGDNGVLDETVATDLEGLPRRVDDPAVVDTGSGAPPLVDMGAYERQTIDPQREGRRRLVHRGFAPPCPAPRSSGGLASGSRQEEAGGPSDPRR